MRLLHKARYLRDSIHAIQRAEDDDDKEEGKAGKGEEERRRRRVAKVTPAYLLHRVEHDLALPHVEVGRKIEGGGQYLKETMPGLTTTSTTVEEEEEEEDMMRDVGEFVLGGDLPGELFIELMDLLIPRYDPCRHL